MATSSGSSEAFRDLLATLGYTDHADRLWGQGVRDISAIANADKDDLAAALAFGETFVPGHKVQASNMIAKAKAAKAAKAAGESL